MNKRLQRGIAFIWIIVASALLISSVGSEVLPAGVDYHCIPDIFADSRFNPPANINFMATGEAMPPRDEDLLKILPPKERSELESAIKEAQEAVKNIEFFDPSVMDINPSNWDFGSINKQAQKEIKKRQEKSQKGFTPPKIDYGKLDKYLKENPQYPAGSQPKSPREQQLDVFEEKTGIDLDAPH